MNKKGIALIMAVGVLALLAIIATSFALNMRLEYHAATNYYNGVKARYFAESALERAIAELRADARTTAFDYPSEGWAANGYSNDGSSGSPDLGVNLLAGHGVSQTSHIYDEQRKINTNMDDATVRLLLNNLVAILKGQSVKPKLDNTEGNEIMNNRPSGAGYHTLREILPKLPDSDTYPRKDRFADLQAYLTTYSYRDPNCANRAPININTADREVIAAVIMNIANTSSADIPVDVFAIQIGDAWQLAGDIITYENRAGGTSSNPITSWTEFDAVIQLAVGGYLDSDQATVIKYNCNPNRPKPTTHTTEFCFNSGGYYNVVATGSATESIGPIVRNLSTRTLSAVIKIYDIYCETKIKDASGNPIQFALGTPERVTWLDSCPVRSDQVFGVYAIPSNAEKIEGSIKLGFWDDFHSTNQGGDRAYSKKHWGGAWGGDPEAFSDHDGDTYDELITSAGERIDLYGTNGYSEWTWGDFMLRISADEYSPVASGTPQIKDVAWIFFRKPSNAGLLTEPNISMAIHTRDNLVLSWDGTAYAYLDPPGNTDGTVEFLSADDAKTKFGYATIQDAIDNRYKYPAQIRIFTKYANDEDENNDSDTYKENFSYTNNKTFNIKTKYDDSDSKKIEVTVLPSSGGSGTYHRQLEESAWDAGRIVLYANNVNVAWKDVRIIPASPTSAYNYPSTFISQMIDSSKINELSTTGVEWGTITGTITLPQEPIWNPGDQFKWEFRTKVGALTQFQPASPNEVLPDNLFTVICATSALNSSSPGAKINMSPSFSGDKKTPLQYKVELQTTNMKKTPVLEDVTITYLPKVAIKSYSISAQ